MLKIGAQSIFSDLRKNQVPYPILFWLKTIPRPRLREQKKQLNQSRSSGGDRFQTYIHTHTFIERVALV